LQANQKTWTGAWGLKKYQCQLAPRPARLALEFPQNSNSTPAYFQRQKEDESSKELGTMQDNDDDNRHSYDSPTRNKGRTIVLVLEDLHHTTI
jgi:hypothetical protein